jgi:outer membrane immunogenic protein
MKRSLIIGAMAFAISAPALAADLPPPSAPPPPRAPAAYVPAPPAFSWTGFYIGLNAGGALGSSTWTAPGASSGSFSVDGPMAGGTIGANYQIGQFVIGAEGDVDWQNIRGSVSTGACSLASCDTASDFLATFRARFGFAADRALLYATAGGAATDIKASSAMLPWNSSTELGWTAGAGVEYAMTDNWTAKVEYLFADFEKATCPAASCGGTGITVGLYENVVRAGVNYKF